MNWAQPAMHVAALPALSQRRPAATLADLTTYHPYHFLALRAMPTFIHCHNKSSPHQGRSSIQVHCPNVPRAEQEDNKNGRVRRIARIAVTCDYPRWTIDPKGMSADVSRMNIREPPAPAIRCHAAYRSVFLLQSRAVEQGALLRFPRALCCSKQAS